MTESIKTPYRRALLERSLKADASLNATGFGEIYNEDATFKIGNLPTAVGRQAIEGFVGGFFKIGTFTRIDHKLQEIWDLPDALIFTAVATFTMLDGTKIPLEYVKIIEYLNELVQRDRVYIDVSPLMADRP